MAKKLKLPPELVAKYEERSRRAASVLVKNWEKNRKKTYDPRKWEKANRREEEEQLGFSIDPETGEVAE